MIQARRKRTSIGFSRRKPDVAVLGPGFGFVELAGETQGPNWVNRKSRRYLEWTGKSPFNHHLRDSCLSNPTSWAVLRSEIFTVEDKICNLDRYDFYISMLLGLLGHIFDMNVISG